MLPTAMRDAPFSAIYVYIYRKLQGAVRDTPSLVALPPFLVRLGWLRRPNCLIGADVMVVLFLFMCQIHVSLLRACAAVL